MPAQQEAAAVMVSQNAMLSMKHYYLRNYQNLVITLISLILGNKALVNKVISHRLCEVNTNR